MTITNTILRNDYVANGSSTVFSFTFIVLSETAGYTIQVITTDLIGIETLKTQGVDYTVQLNDNGLGTITFTTAPLFNHKITLLSNVPNTQETDYIKAGTDKFPAESHEKALDKLTLIAKQFLEKFNRIVSLPKSSTLSNIEFPINASNANQILAINNDGTNLTTTNLADVGIAPVSAYAKTLLDDVNSSEARATLDAQQLNANLTALAGLTGALNKLFYFTSAGAMAVRDLFATTITQGISFLSNPITIANNATDANNDIDFSAGNFQFSDKSNEAVLLAMTKRLDANWVAGTNNGGLDTGSKANSTWYHCYAIHNPTSDVSDAIFSTNATTPTLPSGYTKYKYLGSVLTNVSGNIIAFTQNNNEFKWTAPFSENFDANITTSNKTLTLTVPPVLIKPNVSCYWQGGSVGTRVERLDFTSNLTGVYYMQAITFGSGTAFPHYFDTVINKMIINDKNILYKATVGGAGGTGFCYTNGYYNLSL
jgi:hypothetical protein